MSDAQPVARLGDTSDHGGTIVKVATLHTLVNGENVACVGDIHHCPIKNHGDTEIVDGSDRFSIQGRKVAKVGSKTGCGATINSGSPTFKIV